MRNDHGAVTMDGGNIAIHVNCCECGDLHTPEVPGDSYMRWIAGELVQNAFPDISGEKRELLVSEACPACFRKMPGEAPGTSTPPAE